MRIGLYYCSCGMDDMGDQTGAIDAAELERRLVGLHGIAYFKPVEFVCSEAGCEMLQQHLEENRPDRVIITVCSVRDHEETMRAVLGKAGMNPYYLQLVNVREHVAWVTEGSVPATEKAILYLRAAAQRVQLHEPLEASEIELSSGALVIGGGPAGLKAALTLAEGGRQVTVVESGPILGGIPARVEDVFPRMECGPCLMEPVLNQMLHGPAADKITLMLNSEVTDVSGFFGHFQVKVTQQPRYVSIHNCVGCGMCMEVCPSSLPARINQGRTQRKAIDGEFMGGLPHAPFIETDACLHFHPPADANGSAPCALCQETCPVPDTIRFDDAEKVVELETGAIIVAVGGALYDCARFPNLGYGKIPDVYTSYEYERILAGNGPTEGQVLCLDGKPAQSVAFIHCVGSLDPQHKTYCSGICCLEAFKLSHLTHKKQPETRITHFYKTIVAPGKEEYSAYSHCRTHSSFILYDNLDDFRIELAADGRKIVRPGIPRKGRRVWPRRCSGDDRQEWIVDIVVLLSALVPSPSTSKLAQVLDLTPDPHGFFEEMHNRTDACRSGVRGIYLAGNCQSPMDLQRAMTQGAAAAGHTLSALVPGRTLVVSPVVATVDESRCSGCWTCIPVCPYKAISRLDDKPVAQVNAVLCTGCGTCVAACPAGVIKGNQFTNEEIYAEIEELLA